MTKIGEFMVFDLRFVVLLNLILRFLLQTESLLSAVVAPAPKKSNSDGIRGRTLVLHEFPA